MPAVKKQIRKTIQAKKPLPKAKKVASPRVPALKERSSGAFYKMVMSGICYALSFTATVLSLVALQLTGEVEVDTLLAATPTYSNNLVYFEPLHVDMPIMDNLAETFVRMYITATSTVYKNAKEQNFLWNGVVPQLSHYRVLENFRKRTKKVFDGETPPKKSVDTHIKKISKEGWNSWIVFFDTRTLQTDIDVPVVESWVATIQFRYYAYNRYMGKRFKNPMGFTVTRFDLAREK